MRLPEAFTFLSPMKINCGSQALSHLPFELAARRLSTPLILACRDRIGEKRVGRVCDAFKSSGLNLGVYDRLAETPEDDILPALARMYDDGSCDSIVAVGTGTVVDMAKRLDLLVSTAPPATNRSENGENNKDIGSLRPLMLVATPGGDGFEATGHAVDGRQRLRTPRLVPAVAVIDPVMMNGETDRDVVNGAMIGLVHAVETFLDEGAGPCARAWAQSAIRLIIQYLPGALQNRDRRRNLTAVVNGQVAAGCAFSATAPGICHRIAHSLSSHGDFPVGFLMAILLPHLVDVAGDIAPQPVADLLFPMAGPDVYGQTADPLKIHRIVAQIWEFLAAVNQCSADPIPETLPAIGLTREQINSLNVAQSTDGNDPVARIIDGATKGMSLLAG